MVTINETFCIKSCISILAESLVNKGLRTNSYWKDYKIYDLMQLFSSYSLKKMHYEGRVISGC
jgi:hypothetical protein